MDPKEENIKVLMLPWLAHGHISPFLELAKLISHRNFYIYLCSTPTNLNSIKEKITQKYSSSIELVELELPSLPELPSHYHTTNGLPPHLMPTLKRAFDMSKTKFATILEDKSPHLLIYDFLQPWAPEIAISLNIPSVLFFTTAAVSSSYIHHAKNNPSSEFPFPSIFLRDHEKIRSINRIIQPSGNDTRDTDKVGECIQKSCGVVLIRTSNVLEKRYIDYITTRYEKKVVAAGSLIQEPNLEDHKPEIIRWLDSKGDKSTVFASFGSEYFLTREEMEEIAQGLELSNVNFVWVIRSHLAEHSKVEEVLPKGFIERTKDRGVVITGWAPQAKILRHDSIGGFLSHCGWGSVIESIEFGVPIIALPMQLDQPFSCRLIEELGVGVEVKRDENGRVDRNEVAKVVDGVVSGKNGEVIRSKSEKLGKEMRNKGKEEIDVVVQELINLYLHRKYHQTFRG